MGYTRIFALLCIFEYNPGGMKCSSNFGEVKFIGTTVLSQFIVSSAEIFCKNREKLHIAEIELMLELNLGYLLQKLAL